MMYSFYSSLFRHLLTAIAFGIAAFSTVNVSAQCSADDIEINFQSSPCDNDQIVYVWANADASDFYLYKYVDGWGWTAWDGVANDAPPVQFNIPVNEPARFGISYYNPTYSCESPLKEFTLNPAPSMPSVSGTNQICSGQSTTLTASATGTGVTYQWYEGSTLISGATSSQYNTGALTSSKTYKVSAISASGCESQKASRTVTVNANVTPSVTVASNKTEVCEGDYTTITFTATPTNGGSGPMYSWYVDDGFVTSGSSNSFNYNTSSLSAGSHNVHAVLTSNAACVSPVTGTSAKRYFSVTSPPVIYASEGTSACVNADTYTYVTDPGLSDYSWTVVGGTITQGQGTRGIEAQWTSAGSKSVEVHFSASGACSYATFATLPVTVYSPPTPSITQGTPSACVGIGGQVYTTQSGMSGYQWTASGGTITAGQGTHEITVTWNSAGSRSVSVDYNGPGNCASVTPATYPVTVYSAVTMASAGADQNGTASCGQTTLSANSPNVGNASWSIVSGGTGSFGNASSPSSSFSGTPGGTYVLRWTIGNTCSSSSDDVTVHFDANPTDAQAGSDQTSAATCGLTSVILSANSPTVGTGGWTKVSGSGGSFENSGSGTSIFNGSPGVSYELRWQTVNGPCTSSDIVNVKLNVPSFGGTASPSTEMYGMATGNLAVTGPPVGLVQKWQQKVASGNWTDVNNITTVLRYTDVATTTSYRAVLKNGICPPDYSDEAVVAVYAIPAVQVDGPDALLPGETTRLVADGGFYSYQWQMDHVAISGETSAELVVTKPGNYQLSVRATAAAPIYTTGDLVIGEAYGSQNLNYILTTALLKEGIGLQTDLYDLSLDARNQTVQYFDGLGRPMQTLNVGGSPGGKDIVQPVAYDEFGREQYKYLPYATGIRDGRFISTALVDQANFYVTDADVDHDDHPFEKTLFDVSPLNRILKQGAPGAAWQPDEDPYATTDDHSVKFSYELNTTDDNVLLWTYSESTTTYPLGLVNASTGGAPEYYGPNQLFKTKAKDEDQHEVVEFKDKFDRLIMRSVQGPVGTWAKTYYIYDDFNNLITVLPPEATARLSTEYFNQNDANKDSFLKRWAFRYTYDGRRRLTQKQVPGASPIYMVYDKRDRLALTQDGNQRATAPYYWSFTKYDELNRPILTGIKDTAYDIGQAAMQEVVDHFYSQSNGKLGETYDDSKPIHGYSNDTYPVFTSGTVADPNHFLTVTYYDDYDFRDQWVDDYVYVDEELSATLDGERDDQPDQESFNVKGQVTGTKVKVLDGGPRGGYSWLKTINYYDDEYRLIQSIADNYKGGQDRLTSLYDFTGKVLKTKTVHTTNEISWTGLVNTIVTGNNLNKASLVNGWNAGGVTNERLPAGVDGWIECVVGDPSQRSAFGLTSVNQGESYTTIDYSFWHDGNTAKIYKDGALRYTLSGPVKAGDVVRIERAGSSVNYYWNGVLIHTITGASTGALIGDACIDSSAGSILVPRASFNSRADSIMRSFVYDHTGRLTEIWHRVNANDAARIAYNEYNELGQLVDKKLHSTNALAANAVQSVDYRYNIRGWLTDMNEIDLDADEPGDPRDYFSFQLAYENDDAQIGNTPTFNGNISAMKWSANLGVDAEKMKAYSYGYDPMNRITSATYKTGTGEVSSLLWSVPTGSAFSESGYSYDLNGNIMGLTRKDQNGDDLDILEYNYGSGSTHSNQLLKVTDTGSKTEGFTEITGEGDDYKYDENGNLVWDKNKGGQEILQNGGFSNGSTSWLVTDTGGRLTFQDDSLNVTTHASASATIRQDNIILKKSAYVVIVDMIRTSGNISINIGNGGATSISNSGETVFTKQAGTGDDFVVTIPATFSGHIKRIELKGVVVISYNHLNLPERIVKGLQQSMQYIYDASGRKISQEVYGEDGLITKKSDYEGEFVYENDTLKFVNHDEGRVIVAKTQVNLIGNADAKTTEGFAAGKNTIYNEVLGGETYIVGTAGALDSTPGIWLSAPIAVETNQHFAFKIQGFTEGIGKASFSVWGNNNQDLVWQQKYLPKGQGNEGWIEAEFSVPAGMTSFRLGVFWDNTLDPLDVDDLIYVNKVMLLTDSIKQDAEYQYHLKDHLGNVRLTFTTRAEVDTSAATLEAEYSHEERAKFLNYEEAIVVNHELFDHTSDSTVNETYNAVRLTGGSTAEKFGLARSLSVMPGDEISMEVWAKYLDPDPENWQGAFETFLDEYASGGAPAGTVVDGGLAGSIGAATFPYASLLERDNVDEVAPKAFLTWLVFDRDFNPLIEESGFVQIGSSGELPKENGTNVAHELLKRETPLKIKKAGYVYIYLSNENETPVEVYFDDFKVEQIKSPVVQMDDYYPFGLTFNSYQRENSVDQRWRFQGQEHIDDLGLNWDAFKWRNHQPDIGRFFTIDPLAEKFYYNSPYAFSENKVTSHVELEGAEALSFMTHWALYGHNALVTYPVDWLQDKIIGGGLKMAEGAHEYAKNEYDHKQYQEQPSSEQMVPEDVEQLNYAVNKMQATGKMVEGLSDQAAGYTTLQSLFIGGLESAVAVGVENGATRTFNGMIENILSNPQTSADDIAASFTEAGYKASVTELRSGRGQQVTIEGFSGINTIKVHGGGGRHGLARIEISGSKGVYKIVQGSADDYLGNLEEEIEAGTRFIFTESSN